MMSLSHALTEIVTPAVLSVFKEAEVSEISVRFDPAVHGGAITVSLTAEDEHFSDLVVQGDVDGYSVEDWRERLRSNMADFVAESRFGWGQNRGV